MGTAVAVSDQSDEEISDKFDYETDTKEYHCMKPQTKCEKTENVISRNGNIFGILLDKNRDKIGLLSNAYF